MSGGLGVDCWWILNYGLLVDCWWISGGSGGHVVDCGGFLVDVWWMSGGCPVDCWWIAGRFSIMVDLPL